MAASGEEGGKLDEILGRELADPELAEGLAERVMGRLPEGPPRPVIGWWVYVAMAAAAVIFMGATVLVSSPWELFTSSSRLTVSIMMANFGAMLIAMGFLGWAAETADFEDSLAGLAIQSFARHPFLKLAVKAAYGVAVVLAVAWVLQPGSALYDAVWLLGPEHGQALGTLGVVLLAGLCLAAANRIVENGQVRLHRVRVFRRFAVIVIFASCVVHYALLAF